jgi:hypothetical protein
MLRDSDCHFDKTQLINFGGKVGDKRVEEFH